MPASPPMRCTVIAGVLFPADLGQAVRQLRKAQGLTQAGLADWAGTGERFVVELERGKPTVQLDKVLKVLDALGARLGVLER